DEVADLVLRTNYLQTQAISLSAFQSAAMLDVHSRLIAFLETEGRIDRRISNLPDESEILDLREAGKGLTCPEFAVLIGHVKLTLSDTLLSSNLPDLPFCHRALTDYFPSKLRETFAEKIAEHRLKREIITNVVVNEIVNWGGITFVFRLAQETGATLPGVCKAYFAAREIFEQRELRDRIASLDNIVPADRQAALLLESRKLIERGTRWLLRFEDPADDVDFMIERYGPGVSLLAGRMTELVDAPMRARIDARRTRIATDTIPQDLSERVACFEELSVALDIVAVAERTGEPVESAAAVYYRIGSALSLHWMRECINQLPRTNRWQTLARTAFREDLDLQERELAFSIIRDGKATRDARPSVELWLKRHRTATQRVRNFMQALMLEPTVDSTMIAAALRELRGLGQLAASGRIEQENNKPASGNP
ncbi:MAG TPA: NAD-glutamate dehydrogenase, partial [Gammaproteobacteria bacterium]|nr:NAD-glutamate dehydrogenase [Gammaproteobacteria bacterium]